MWRFARVYDVGASQFTDRNLPKNVRKSFENRPQSIPEASEAVQIATSRPSKLRFSAQVSNKCVSDDFWAVSGRFFGGSWAPKSSRHRQKWRPQSVSFSIRFWTSVLIDFRRILDPKERPKSTFFRLGSAKPNFAKSSIFVRVLKDCRVSELREYVEERLQNEAGLSTRFGPRFGTVFGRFWGPKTDAKRSKNGLRGTSETLGFRHGFPMALRSASEGPGMPYAAPGLGGAGGSRKGFPTYQLRKFIDCPLVFVRFWRFGPSKIRRETLAERSWSLHAFQTPFRDGFRTILGSQNEPKTNEMRKFGTSRK